MERMDKELTPNEYFLKLKGIVTGYLKDFILNIRLWYT